MNDFSNLTIPTVLKRYLLMCPFKGPDFQIFVCREGNMWGAGLGFNLQDGIAGFGTTIPKALRDLAENIEKEENML